MGRTEHSVRGRVVTKWQKSGKPNWNTQKTLAICIDIDSELETADYAPAPRFREAIKVMNEKYLRNWVQGCHFPWLNPR